MKSNQMVGYVIIILLGLGIGGLFLFVIDSHNNLQISTQKTTQTSHQISGGN